MSVHKSTVSKKVVISRQGGESRVPGENRDPVLDMVPDFRRDDVWMPPYQVRGRLLKSGMTEKNIYKQTLFRRTTEKQGVWK